jgi:UDP-3-O-[3-hydroxymyristoyl] glucosamine N-acyltransferase
MADPRFFQRAGPHSLDALAALTGARLADPANGGRLIEDVAPLETAGPADVTFLDNRKYTDAFVNSRAGAAFVAEALAPRAPAGMAILISPEPYKAFARAAQAFYPPLPRAAGRAPSAVIDPAAIVPDDCLIGSRVMLHPGVRIGQAGFGFAPDRAGPVKIPQLGRVIIGDDVDIGANTTIDRGSGHDTVIGPGTMIDNLVQIGHNVVLGRGCILAGQVGISGSTKLGDFVMAGGQAGLAGHLNIGAGARIGAQAGLMKDVAPGATVGGYPAVPMRQWLKQVALLALLVEKKGDT